MNPAHAKMHQDLVAAMARLEASRREVGKTRQAAVDRASEQLDTMPRAISVLERAQVADKAGGIMGHRALRTKLTERVRLESVVAAHQDRPGR